MDRKNSNRIQVNKLEFEADVMKEHIDSYLSKLTGALRVQRWDGVIKLVESLQKARENKSQIFICGNGGSAANAEHLANDFLYGAVDSSGIGLRVEALSANSSVITCLANDISYQEIFSSQLKVKGNEGDLLIALSGSGNSNNILRAVQMGNSIGMTTFGILGFNGGECKNLCQVLIHCPVNDMQISEDFQLIVGHMCMQWLSSEK